MNHFVETAIVEKLEDLLDVEIIQERDNEELVDWKQKA